jgi:hypothetical protein
VGGASIKLVLKLSVENELLAVSGQNHLTCNIIPINAQSLNTWQGTAMHSCRIINIKCHHKYMAVIETIE